MRRKRRVSPRPFYATLLVVSFMTLLSLFVHRRAGSDWRSAGTHTLLRRASEDGAECRLVHRAQDKCAFIKENCIDEDAGLFSYLTLYYCRLPHAQFVAFAIIVLWLSILFSTIGIAASDFFCINLSTIASILGMSESMAGVTFLAFGNGSPDVFSTFAAMSTNSGSLALGELIGAASFITAVVAGSMALVRPFKVARKSFVRDVSFFIVATSFSMVFLADGALHLWECAVMVGFYIFYVCVVVLWHWWLGRRKQNRQKEAAARSHFVLPDSEDVGTREEYRDDEEVAFLDRPHASRNSSAADFRSLEQSDVVEAHDVGEGEDEDESEEARDRWFGELSSNMRLSRPSPVERRRSSRPIRPSLVGALEFRAVLSTLQKSQNTHNMPINLKMPVHLRRHSDDPRNKMTREDDYMIQPENEAQYLHEFDGRSVSMSVAGERPSLDFDRPVPESRARAVSAVDAARATLEPTLLERRFNPSPGKSTAMSPSKGELLGLPMSEDTSSTDRGAALTSDLLSPAIAISSPPLESNTQAVRSASPASYQGMEDLPAAPGNGHVGSMRPEQKPPLHYLSPTNLTPAASPRTRPKDYPKVVIPASERTQCPVTYSPFPSYREHPMSTPTASKPPSMMLPPSASAGSSFDGAYENRKHMQKPTKWWPYNILPPPQILYSVLFPTLYGWRKKSIWEKLLGLVSAPSVFLLTITLPVVELERITEADELASTPAAQATRSGKTVTPIAGQNLQLTPSPLPTPSHDVGSPRMAGAGARKVTAAASTVLEVQPTRHHPEEHQQGLNASYSNAHDSPASLPQEWNRWLIVLQCFTAPLFTACILWLNIAEDPKSLRGLVRVILYSLLVNFILLVLLVATTTHSQPPRWRGILGFFGFTVSIAWISSIANEVVGVLKTIGVVLDISDAILGLTVFAVGNSLGDLVADITIARLGYPVMALSACFGGPMLNILLGIGLSGLYKTIRRAERKHDLHPDKPTRFQPFYIEVSSTLLITGVTLLVTLVGLLVVVPLNGWRMDKRIGWGLITLWCASTVVNLVVEIGGWGGDISL